jgi:hypothetical protein
VGRLHSLRRSTEKDRPQAGGYIFVNGLIPMQPKQAQALEPDSTTLAFALQKLRGSLRRIPATDAVFSKGLL